ncbi:MAG TPA: hypothetical protein VFI46_04560, partial [Jiangellaceae bacterium]|nr:hypothetical protein [Jiangellaceae bacterium]
MNQRTVWCQRIHAQLYQHGVAVPEGAIRTPKTRAMLADDALVLSPAGRQRITVGYRMIDATDAEAQPLKRDLQRFGARRPACRALIDAQYGIGGLIAVAVWSELGDCRRFSRSEQAARHATADLVTCWRPYKGCRPRRPGVYPTHRRHPTRDGRTPTLLPWKRANATRASGWPSWSRPSRWPPTWGWVSPWSMSCDRG